MLFILQMSSPMITADHQKNKQYSHVVNLTKHHAIDLK